MADFVDQHVAGDMRKVFLGLAPLVEDRAPVKRDNIDIFGRVGDTFAIQRDAAIQSQQIERALEPHLTFGRCVWEIVDPNDETLDLIPEFLWNGL